MVSIKGRYARIEIPLDNAETGKELHITGDYLSIISITGDGTCEIKLDHRHSQTINLREISGISGIFERLYFTTDGAGGTCTIFVGTGMAIQVLPNPEKLGGAGATGTQITCPHDAVQGLASEPLILTDVTIFNTDVQFDVCVGPYNANLAIFKAYAYTIRPQKTLEFSRIDMHTLGACARVAPNTPIIHIIGTYD